MDFKRYFCADCGGVAHPATGCQYTETTIICGPCTRKVWTWVKGWTNKQKKVNKHSGDKQRVSFYEAAGRNRPKDNGV